MGNPSLTPVWGTGPVPSSHSIASLKCLDVLRTHPGSGPLSLRPPYAPELLGDLGQNIDPTPHLTHASLESLGAGSGNLFLFWAVARRLFLPQPACSQSSSLQKHLSPDNNSWSHWYRGPEVLKHHEAKHTFKKLFIESCLLTTSHLGIIISHYSWHLVETTSLRFFHHVIALQWLSEFLQDKCLLFISDAYMAWTFQFSENQNNDHSEHWWCAPWVLGTVLSAWHELTHFILSQGMKEDEAGAFVVESLGCVGLFCDPMDCSLPGSSVHGILQARILEWVAIPFSRGSSWPRDWAKVCHLAGRFFTIWATRETIHQFKPWKIACHRPQEGEVGDSSRLSHSCYFYCGVSWSLWRSQSILIQPLSWSLRRWLQLHVFKETLCFLERWVAGGRCAPSNSCAC